MDTPNRPHSDVKGEVMYVAHDLEPAIASFQTILRLLKREAFDHHNPMHQRLLGSSEVALQFAKRTLANMLEYSCLQENRIVLAATWIDSSACEDMLAIPRLLASEKDVQVRLEYPAQTHTFFSDHSLVERILINLAMNAVKHSPSGSTVIVNVGPSERGCRISIEDCGAGLSEAQLRTVLEKPLEIQLENGAKYRGAGLGLRFCRDACVKLGGSMSMERRNAQGLRSIVLLPDLPHPQ